MKKLILLSLFLFVSISNIQSQSARSSEFLVIPPDYTTVGGTSTFLGPLANANRSYQLLIHESYLTQFISKEIVGLSWRLPSSATAAWPTSDLTYSTYDVYLSGSVPPASRSLNFIDNVVGTQRLVRSGPLQILANAYPFGSNPNEFGSEITFTQSYTYSGGHLLIEIRHQGFSGTSRSVDAIGTATAGYGTLFSALWQSSYTPTTGTQGNFSVVKLRFENPIPVELTSFTANVIGNKVKLNWTTATELNNQGFEIQRKVKSDKGSEWERVDFVAGFGTITETKSYSYTDEVDPGSYLYRLKQIDFDGSFSFSNEIEVEVNTPQNFSLNQNYPNPFFATGRSASGGNSGTTISWQSSVGSWQTLKVYDVLGNEIATLVNDYREAGKHEVNFDASNLPSGIYYYQLSADGFTESKKMLLIK
jgi:hypothetical protein